MRRFITRRNIFLLLAILIISLIGFRVYSARTKKPSYETVAAQKTTITQIVSASGEIKSDSQVDLKFPVSGKVTYLAVKKNDRVKAGSYVASLDKRALQKTLEKSLRDYSKERNDFDQTSQVTYKDQVITDTIRRILEKNQWDLDKSVLDVELADLAKQYADLVSPIAGVVTNVVTPAGTSEIAGTTTIVTIANPDQVNFIAEVDESDIAQMAVDQEANITLDAFPGKTFTGKVVDIDYASSTATSGSNVYLVKIALDDVSNLRIGMNGDIEITIAKHNDALVIPKGAVEQKNGERSVMVLENGAPKKQVVQVGLISPTSVEITNGLTPGQAVIVGGGTP